METSSLPQDAPRGCPPISYLSVRQFRRFERLRRDNLAWVNVITGANGSGKTSILWAVVIALQSFNKRVEGSRWGAEQGDVVIEGMDLSLLINAPHFESASWRSIARQGAKEEPTEIDAVIDKRSISMAFKGNGVITLNEKKGLYDSLAVKKVHIAYMAECTFGWPSADSIPGEMLTSAAGGIRRRFVRLTKRGGHGEVIAHMKQLFGIQNLRFDMSGGYPWIFIVESRGDEEVEIMYTGKGLCKVFTALVLFYTLLGRQIEGKCVYLVEDPEAHLHPTLQLSFAAMLLELARKHQVQLFVTTNSRHIFSSVQAQDVIVLAGNHI